MPINPINFGVYIHIPFCATKCNYCSFISRPWHEDLAQRYWQAVVREIDAFFLAHPDWGVAKTIYFGGGTPSIVPSKHIAGILYACKNAFEISPECEISLEANPGTLTPEKVADYRQMGINRVSMGAQTFDDRELVSIGRIHTADQVGQSLTLLRSFGFENLNLDLILGLPSQTAAKWTENLRRVSELAPEHISVYMLDLDAKAPLYHSVVNGLYSVPDEDAVSEWYLETLDHLCRLGYEQYEISNFALPGFACRHNLKYWEREPTLGFGIGSHSFDGEARYANVSKMDTYMQLVEKGGSPVEWRQTILTEAGLQETLFLQLRLTRGLDWNQIRTHFRSPHLSKYESSLRNMTVEGLVEWSDSLVRLTPRGMLLSNEIFREFV